MLQEKIPNLPPAEDVQRVQLDIDMDSEARLIISYRLEVTGGLKSSTHIRGLRDGT